MQAMETDSDAYIRITGGVLYINAQGDGVDSNGALYVSGGKTYVDGPENSGNGALDYNGYCRNNGRSVCSCRCNGHGAELWLCNRLRGNAGRYFGKRRR